MSSPTEVHVHVGCLECGEQEKPCPAKDASGKVCCYAEGHEKRSGMPHRYVALDDKDASLRRHAEEHTGRVSVDLDWLATVLGIQRRE